MLTRTDLVGRSFRIFRRSFETLGYDHEFQDKGVEGFFAFF